MKRLVMAVALACLLPVSGLAGDIPTADSASPSPGKNRPACSTSQGGNIVIDPMCSETQQTTADGIETVILAILDLIY